MGCCDTLTIDVIRRAAKNLTDTSVPKRVVESEEQAKWMTKHDPASHVWQVGEQFMYFAAIPR